MNPQPLKDNWRFEDETEEVVFHQYSFFELLKHIMVRFGGLTYEAATEKLAQSYVIQPPHSKGDVEFLSQELPFHWAMLAAFGEMYWLKGIPSDYLAFKTAYEEWEAEILQKHNLKEPFEFLDKTSS